MHRSIDPHELSKIDLAPFQVVQVSDGTHTVVLWEAPEPDLSMGPHMQAATLTIRLCDPLNPVRRKDVCEHLQWHLSAMRNERRAARERPRAHQATLSQCQQRRTAQRAVPLRALVPLPSYRQATDSLSSGKSAIPGPF